MSRPKVAAGTPPRRWVLRTEVRLWTHNAERQLHWSKRAAMTRSIRHAFAELARSLAIPLLRRVDIAAQPYQARGRLADPGGFDGPVKAAVDGLVDAGVLEDDSGAFVRSLTHLATKKAPGTYDELELIVEEAAS